MLKTILLTTIMIGLFLGCTAKNKPPKQVWTFQSSPINNVIILQEGREKNYCPNCGMTLAMFYKSNHVATVDGRQKQYCSLHCLTENIMQGKEISNIQVVDITSSTFVDASTATYIVGSAKKGTMSGISKYAFASQSDAGDFMLANGGEMMGLEEALEVAEKDFSTKAKEKMHEKKMKMAKKGKNIYQLQCTQTTKENFSSVAQAKTYIKETNLCPTLEGKALHAVGLYLFTK